jgi:hypothetical protein
LPGFDQETGAIGNPFIDSFHECDQFVCCRLIVIGKKFAVTVLRLPAPICCLGAGWITFCERAKVNVRAKARAVNSVFLVQLRKCKLPVVTSEHCASESNCARGKRA